MIIWDKARTTSQKLAQDSSTDGIEFLDLMMNVGYKEILADFGRQVTEIEATADLVAGQRGYQMPPDCLWPKTIELIDGTTIIPVFEEPSDKYWAVLKSGATRGRPTRFHYKPRFGIGGGVLELDPIPSSSSYDIRLTYESNDKDLSKTVYTTGTVAVTAGSAAVVGTGTTFTADMVGRYFKITADNHDRLWYRIGTFTDTTHISLENVYEGSTGNTLAYQIAEAFNLPEDMHMLPIFYAAWQWWSTKGNMPRAKQFEKQYSDGLILARKRHSLVARDNIINDSGLGLGLEEFTGEYPTHYPTEIS